MSENQSTIVQHHLDRLRAGDLSARDGLMERANDSLERLSRRMFGDYSVAKRWEDAHDVSQNAAIRLWKSLEEVKPATPRDFYRLAALQIRRELLDLARRYSGPMGRGANHQSAAPPGDTSAAMADPGTTTLNPARLAQWIDFHRRIDELPEEWREVFDLLFYQDLPQAEAAGLLAVSEATLRRRWLEARLALKQKLTGESPI